MKAQRFGSRVAQDGRCMVALTSTCCLSNTGDGSKGSNTERKTTAVFRLYNLAYVNGNPTNCTGSGHYEI